MPKKGNSVKVDRNPAIVPDSVALVYEKLYSRMGDLGWWPAETPDEVVIGSILTQNTNWNNVEKSLDRLRHNGLMSLGDLASADRAALASIIRSSGFYNQKSSRLIDLSRRIHENYGGLEGMADETTLDLASFLDGVKGVGRETRDSILLYALDRPVFVMDKYTERIFRRTGHIEGHDGLTDFRDRIPKLLGYDVDKLKNFHGMIVQLAKDHCRKNPICRGCPLSETCDYYREAMLP